MYRAVTPTQVAAEGLWIKQHIATCQPTPSSSAGYELDGQRR